jgi:hypothetical protein
VQTKLFTLTNFLFTTVRRFAKKLDGTDNFAVNDAKRVVWEAKRFCTLLREPGSTEANVKTNEEEVSNDADFEPNEKSPGFTLFKLCLRFANDELVSPRGLENLLSDKGGASCFTDALPLFPKIAGFVGSGDFKQSKSTRGNPTIVQSDTTAPLSFQDFGSNFSQTSVPYGTTYRQLFVVALAQAGFSESADIAKFFEDLRDSFKVANEIRTFNVDKATQIAMDFCTK